MSKGILIVLILVCSNAFAQEATIDDIESYLLENKASIFFEFYISEDICASLKQRPCESSKNCTSISQEKSERLLGILAEKGLLNYHHAFFEKERNFDDFKVKEAESEIKIRLCFESNNEPVWVFSIGKENTKSLLESISTEIQPLPCSLY